jgi:PKD repeat protein
MKKNFLILLITFFLAFSISGKAIAGTEHNLSGWAWSENVGWISFNCYNDYNGDGVLEDHCSSSNYGVKLDPSTKVFSGYAWSEHIGWISFNRSETGAPPTEDPCFDGSCIAKLDPSTNKVYGWAKALVYGGGWDGWIKLNDANYGVTLNSSTGKFEGWATGWDDTPGEAVIGWISFNCKDGGYNETTGEHYSVCGTSNYKVFLTAPLNQPPTANKLSVDAQSSDVICGETEGSRAKFSWNFVDPDPRDSQSAYQIQIDNNSNFSSPEVDTKKTLSSSQTFLLSRPYTLLNWGTTYYWRLMVWDSHDATSTWINGPSFTTPSHSYPVIDFSWDPQRPIVGQVVKFTDTSTVYGGATKSSWYWTFQNGNPSSSTNQNPTTTFSSIGESEINLEITDSSGYSCSVKKFLQTTYPLPFFKEIPPTFFKMKNFFASLISAVLKVKLF